MEDSPLFEPMQIGNLKLSHRIAHAPLTRFRATADHVLDDLIVEYYAQRASTPGTLLISEACPIAPRAGGYKNVPGIWNDEQIAGWKKLVDAVHAKGSFIYLQLWAMGRAAKREVLAGLPGGPYDVVSASDLPFPGGDTPRSLAVKEIEEYVELYAEAARVFVEKAGGDGVEIHCANGYLPNQFLSTASNKRKDEYGGSLENRARFPLAVLDGVVKAVGVKRTAIRISPFSEFQGVKTSSDDIFETYSYFVEQVKARHSDLAYLHGVETRIAADLDTSETAEPESLDFIYDIWTPRPFLDAGGLTPDTALALVKKRNNTVAVFGRPFISNPDLPERVRQGASLTPYDRTTFYTTGAKGYTDYAFATLPAVRTVS